MAILDFHVGETGLAGVAPRFIYLNTNNTLAEVLVTGYLNGLVGQGICLYESDMALVSTRTSPASAVRAVSLLEVSKTGSDYSLISSSTPGSVVLPSDTNYIAHFTNTMGEISSAPADIINAGSISAGISGTAGTFISYPPTAALGTLVLESANNAANYTITITNSSHGQSTSYALPDVGEAAGSILVNFLDDADPNMNMVSFTTTVTSADLASAGVKVLFAGSGTKQYILRHLYINQGTNFAGGGGDRELRVSDDSRDFSTIPAAALANVTNAVWGSTDLPINSTSPMVDWTTAGGDITCYYVSGAADYTGGSTVISGILERVA